MNLPQLMTINDPPAFGNEHLADAPIAVAAVLCSKPHDVSRQRRFVIRRL